MSLVPGSRLGFFEVLASLGAGGMGEVYRVRDTRLAREVALKTLPAEFSCDAERLRRFEQEAKSAVRDRVRLGTRRVAKIPVSITPLPRRTAKSSPR